MKTARDPAALRGAMAARGNLTLEETALLARCSKGTISAVLAGKPLNPALARRISRVLRLPVDDLFVAAPSNNEQDSDQHGAVA